MPEPTNECKHLISEPCNSQTRTICTRDYHQAHCKDCGIHLRLRKNEPTNETWKLMMISHLSTCVSLAVSEAYGHYMSVNMKNIETKRFIDGLEKVVSEERKRAQDTLLTELDSILQNAYEQENPVSYIYGEMDKYAISIGLAFKE